VVDFYLDNFVDFEALPGPLHDLLDGEAVVQGMSASGALVSHLKKGNIGSSVPIKLLQHLLGKLNGHCPVFLLC
jgi:hypothetical protein